MASDDLDVLVVVAVGSPGTSRTKRLEAVANVASALAMYEAPGFYEDGLLLVTSTLQMARAQRFSSSRTSSS